MKLIEATIHQIKRRILPPYFFENFNNSNDIKLISDCGIGLAFWFMTFQDMLRINVGKFEDPT